jgi:DNA-binding CsgD family transcriptional regulator/PAS domain-containing protein
MRHRARAGRDSGHSLTQQKTLLLSRKRKEFVDKMANTPSQIVADLYDASIEPSRWPHVLIALGERARADAVGLLFNDFATGRGHFEAAIGIPAEALSSYRRIHSQSNVWLADEQPFRQTNAAIRGSQIVGDEKVKSSSFYNEWLKPIGLLSHLFAVVERESNGVMLLMLARREGKPDFEDDIVGEIQTLAPAVEQALHAGRGVRRLRALENAALRAIDVMPIGVIMLDQNGAVIEANRSARAVLEAGEGLTVANGGLAVDIGGRQTKLRELITRTEKQAAAFASGELTLLPVRRQAGQRPLTLLLMPLEQTIEAHVKQAPVALLFIGDPERSVGFDQTRIARLYGLSRAESRVAALLASGYRLEQVAEALDIAYETVRKHLKQIFGKTGTYRQAELVRMLVTGPAGLSI